MQQMVIFFFALLMLVPVTAFPSLVCEGRYKDGSKPNTIKLNRILKDHAVWLESVDKESSSSQANLCNANLRKAILFGRNLRKVNLYGTDLRGASLIGADLRGAILYDADLRGANLYEADLSNAVLYGARIDNKTQIDDKASKTWRSQNNGKQRSLREVDLSWANLSQAELNKVDLRGANLQGANLIGTLMNGSNLRGANLHRTMINDNTQIDEKWKMVWSILNESKKQRILIEADLKRADLREAELNEADLSGSDLSFTKINKANLEKARLCWADLSSAELKETVLIEADLSWADLFNANMIGANLYKANLLGTNLVNGKLSKVDLREADLFGADLSKANLSQANLRKADLRSAELSETNLNRADLSEADLRGADLRNADLEKAILKRALIDANTKINKKWKTVWSILNESNEIRKIKKISLNNQDLAGADLSTSNLTDVNLGNTNLSNVNLSKGTLVNTSLDRAKFTNINLLETQYEPNSTPDKTALGGIQNLETVWFEKEQQSGLVQLRNSLKEAGLRNLERQATYAIEKWKTRYDTSWLKKNARLMFFEYTAGYGLYPVRCLLLLLGFIPIFSLIYFFSIYRKKETKRQSFLITISSPPRTLQNKSGIYRIWSVERIRQDLGSNEPELLTADFFKSIGFALYFSLLSAFHIGWRDLNVGNWIARIQPREYTLRATGWVRTVSGIQSLISIYLLAFWVLTQFGRPFD